MLSSTTAETAKTTSPKAREEIGKACTVAVRKKQKYIKSKCYFLNEFTNRLL